MDTQGALELAGRVNAALAAEGVMPLVIGAVALAAHGYVRGTEDVDGGGFPALIRDATSSPFTFLGGQEGRLVSLEYLILSKLYAGGSKSRGDIEELLVRRKVDLTQLQGLAAKYGLEGGLSRVLHGSRE